MKKKRLGEVLGERNRVSADDLNKAIQDRQGKLVHLGELMLQRGIVSKINLVSALAEVARIQYVDCTLIAEVQTRGEVRYCLPGIGVGAEFVGIADSAVHAILAEIESVRRAKPASSRPTRRPKSTRRRAGKQK